MKIGKGIQSIFWFCLSNQRRYDADITDGMDF
jgi:hypothetical protein